MPPGSASPPGADDERSLRRLAEGHLAVGPCRLLRARAGDGLDPWSPKASIAVRPIDAAGFAAEEHVGRACSRASTRGRRRGGRCRPREVGQVGEVAEARCVRDTRALRARSAPDASDGCRRGPFAVVDAERLRAIRVEGRAAVERDADGTRS